MPEIIENPNGIWTVRDAERLKRDNIWVAKKFLVDSNNTIINIYAHLTSNISVGSNSIPVSSSSGFSVGDEILILQTQHSTNVGFYEFATISSISGSTFGLSNLISRTYYSGNYSSSSASITQIISVPKYDIVQVNGSASISAKAWDGYSGGVIIFKTIDLIVLGNISASGVGYRGGVGGQIISGCDNYPWPTVAGDRGESYNGSNSIAPCSRLASVVGHLVSTTPFNGGGGGGAGSNSYYGPRNGGGGGGASFTTSGANGSSSSSGESGASAGSIFNIGSMSNNDFYSLLMFGSGGGGGGRGVNASGGNGGSGGGAIYIQATTISGSGAISANGNRGSNGGVSDDGGGGGGGGAGGSIFLVSPNISVSNISATGGSAGNGSSAAQGSGGSGGAAGQGKVRVDSSLYSSVSSPVAYRNN